MTSITKIIRIAKAVRETVTVDGETFYFAAVGCEEGLVEKLSEKGFRLLIDPTFDRGVGLCWRRGR